MSIDTPFSGKLRDVGYYGPTLAERRAFDEEQRIHSLLQSEREVKAMEISRRLTGFLFGDLITLNEAVDMYDLEMGLYDIESRIKNENL